MKSTMGIGRQILAGILVLSLVLAAGCGKKEEEQAAVTESQITVATTYAQIMDLNKSASYTGTVAGKNEVTAVTEAGAKVTNVYIHEGDYVTAGQTIATLDTSNYVNSVTAAQQSYNAATLQPDQAAIQRNQATIQRDQAVIQREQLQLNLTQAENNLNRVKALFESGAATQQDLEGAQNAVDSLNTSLKASDETIRASEETIKAAELAITTAQNAVGMAETQLKTAQDQLAKCTVTAPISGTVGTVFLTVGEMVGVGSKVAVITDSQNLEVALNVSESDISYLSQGSPVSVYIRSASDAPFNGTISSIAGVSSEGKAGYDVKIDLNNTNGRIRSGMFAEVILNTQSSRNTLVLPIDAVIVKAGTSTVFVPNEEGRAHQVEVTTGISNKDYIEITGGIVSGQEVITSGNTLVSEGSKIQILNEEGQ